MSDYCVTVFFRVEADSVNDALEKTLEELSATYFDYHLDIDRVGEWPAEYSENEEVNDE